MNQIINHKNKYYFKTENGYREILSSTDTLFGLPQPSQQFIEKYIEEHNKGNKITDVLVEVIADHSIFNCPISASDCHKFMKNPVDCSGCEYALHKPKLDSQNQITIRKQKDNWSRYEVICLLDKLIRDSQNNPKEVIIQHRVTTKWIEENL